MMDELVQDLVSALEQTSEQSKLGELWEEMVLSPLHQRRQIRRRRGRKRRCDSSLYPLEHRHCLSEASESSLDEAARDCRENTTVAPSTTTASAANCSDSDDMIVTSRWHPFTSGSAKTRQHSWPESDSFTENTPGRPLRRRRKVKRMTSDVTIRLQQKLKVSGVDSKRGCSHRSSKKQRLTQMKKRPGGWVGADRQVEGAGVIAKECWKDKIALEAEEQRDASDENMSEGETSSICSSDPGLFTNDEGRQGDDEQSDWFFEGDCGAGKGVTSLLSSWDSDSQLSLEDPRPSPTFLQPTRPSHRGYHACANRLPGTTARCIRRGRRRLPSKDNSMPLFVERLKRFSQDPYQREFWLTSFGKRDRSQFNPLCPLPVYPIDMVSESSHRRCSSSICKNRQTNIPLGLLCTGDIKRRRKTVAVAITSASHSFQRDDLGEEARGASNTLNLEAVGASGATSAAGPQPSTSEQPDLMQPEILFNPLGDQEEN
ncbi:G patch domain-containing protein 2-like isoform X2 [Myripristis murdjan]|nr:G patch domain-containing protein 2-like isoform X2 [Myripristis murdjan]XP_029900167.1 G patch domain-containing protein 2-like isoform X2 [Myripristis murdjan]